jgi:hypothetical protein
MLIHDDSAAFVGDAEPGDVNPQPGVKPQGFSAMHRLLAALPWPASLGAIEHEASRAT